jgi:hypothetical protein
MGGPLMDFNINKNTAYEIIGRISPTVQNPIFIIGSGRCGTSLLVRILSSHSGLFSFPGEANDLWHPKSYPFNKRLIETPTILENPKLFTQISLRCWPEGHIKKIRNTFSGFNILFGFNRQFFSKSAMLSFMIPSILTIFPDAIFIHIYRNGPSVVSSLIKKEWGKYSRHFANEFDYRLSCATYWNDCILEIETRKKELLLETKGQFYEFSYEQLCTSPKSTIKGLSSFIGIDPEAFKFNFSNISSRNYKIGNYQDDNTWIPLLKAMSKAMHLKGYET